MPHLLMSNNEPDTAAALADFQIPVPQIPVPQFCSSVA